MSTATLPDAGPIGTHPRSFWRFAWKEYRMLRGFWLAVAVLAVVIQLIVLATLPRGDERASMLFSVALGATVLYAVGAAATLFAVEHEEETYDLLTTLPVEWLSAFFAKLFVAVISSLALLFVLVGITFALGGAWNTDVAYLLLPAIAEVIAWGIFMSLTIRRPLVAAVATIAVVSAQVNMLMAFVSETGLSISDTSSYPSILPWRLAIAAVVLLIDLALGREWLRVPKTRRSKSVASAKAMPIVSPAQTAGKVSTLRMMSRLLWQTWRESRLSIALTMIFAGVLGVFGLLSLIAIGSPVIRPSFGVAIVFSFSIILSAVYASGVFGSDQRGRSYRFLAERCARPGMVWLSRHIVWGGSLAMVLALLAAIAMFRYGADTEEWVWNRAISYFSWNSEWRWYGDSYLGVFRQLRDTQLRINLVQLAVIGVIAGFAIGQLSSLLLRRSLSAGFLSLSIALLLTLWGLVIWVWKVPGGWTFAFAPIVAALFLASWLRSSNWLIDRNTKRDWAWLSAILFVPVAFAFFYVSQVRVSEVPTVQLSQADWPVAQASDMSNDDDALAAGEALVRARESIVPSEIPQGELIEEGSIRRVLSSRQEIAWRKDYIEKNEELIDLVIEVSKARSCSFSDSSNDGISNGQLIYLVDFLTIAGTVNTYDGNLDRSLECYLAALRVLGHAKRGANMWSGDFRLDELGLILAGLREWSLHESQTSEQLLKAIEQLDKVLPTTPQQWSAALSSDGYLPPLPSRARDYRIIRERIMGQREPSYSQRPDGRFHFRIVNELPFERNRALRILDHIEQSEWNSGGKQLLATIDGNWVMENGEKGDLEGNIASELRRSISYFDRIEQGLSSFESQQLLPRPWSWLSTTYFLAYEYDGRTSFRRFLQNFADYYAEERALKLQFALLAYRIDHGSYPRELEALLPQYLLEMPLDPYSGGEFKYEPDGLPGELTAWHRGRMKITLLPETPFFWSVGHTYARLQGSTTTVPIAEEDEDDLSLWKKRWVYRLDAGDFIVEAPLVFPLPPITATDSEDTQ